MTSPTVELEDVEDAIDNARGDSLLMIMALEQATKDDAWELLKLEKLPEYHLLLVKNETYEALMHAAYRTFRSVRQVQEVFHGRAEAPQNPRGSA